MKRLLRDSRSHFKVDNELRAYRGLSDAVDGMPGALYIMRFHAVLGRYWQGSDSEIYMLWTPLAQVGDFSKFGSNSPLRQSVPNNVKLQLYYQALIGLEALYHAGYIRRDLKSQNIGIVSLRERPRTVLIDFGQTIHLDQGHDLTPSPAHCGTIGYLAPELENPQYAASYGQPIDIWSIGAVGYYLFDGGGRIPWSTKRNMFLPERDGNLSAIHVFESHHATLRERPAGSLDALIASMLETDLRRRPTAKELLEHAALRNVVGSIVSSIR